MAYNFIYCLPLTLLHINDSFEGCWQQRIESTKTTITPAEKNAKKRLMSKYVTQGEPYLLYVQRSIQFLLPLNSGLLELAPPGAEDGLLVPDLTASIVTSIQELVGSGGHAGYQGLVGLDLCLKHLQRKY